MVWALRAQSVSVWGPNRRFGTEIFVITGGEAAGDFDTGRRFRMDVRRKPEFRGRKCRSDGRGPAPQDVQNHLWDPQNLDFSHIFHRFSIEKYFIPEHPQTVPSTLRTSKYTFFRIISADPTPKNPSFPNIPETVRTPPDHQKRLLFCTGPRDRASLSGGEPRDEAKQRGERRVQTSIDRRLGHLPSHPPPFLRLQYVKNSAFFRKNTQSPITLNSDRIAMCTFHQSIGRETENRLHTFLSDAPL